MTDQQWRDLAVNISNELGISTDGPNRDQPNPQVLRILETALAKAYTDGQNSEVRAGQKLDVLLSHVYNVIGELQRVVKNIEAQR